MLKHERFNSLGEKTRSTVTDLGSRAFPVNEKALLPGFTTLASRSAHSVFLTATFLVTLIFGAQDVLAWQFSSTTLEQSEKWISVENLGHGFWSYEALSDHLTPRKVRGVAVQHNDSLILVNSGWNTRQAKNIVTTLKSKTGLKVSAVVLTEVKRHAFGGAPYFMENNIPVYGAVPSAFPLPGVLPIDKLASALNRQGFRQTRPPLFFGEVFKAGKTSIWVASNDFKIAYFSSALSEAKVIGMVCAEDDARQGCATGLESIANHWGDSEKDFRDTDEILNTKRAQNPRRAEL